VNYPDFVSALRGAAPYLYAHHGRTFVIALPGETCALREFEKLIGDIALLSRLGVKLVIVHGARPQIDVQMAMRGLDSVYVGDIRVTDEPGMDAVKAAVGALRIDIEAMLSSSMANNSMPGARIQVVGGNWVTARPVGVREGIDHLLTGMVRRVDIDAIREVLAADRIALISPVGYSPTGEGFNLRDAEIAEAVATGLCADKLIFVVESDPGKWDLADSAGDAGQLFISEAETLLAAGSVLESLSPGDRFCVLAGLAAGRAGVGRVHLVGAGADGALLRELYTRDGSGLMFFADEDYEATRGATIEDVAGILALIRPLEAAEILLPRSREQIELDIESFSVIVRDGMVIACGAMIPFPEDTVAEFACVAVHPQYRGRNRAGTLLRHAEATARQQGIQRLFALTTATPHWFIEHGFEAGGRDDLPERKRSDYNENRNSMVMVKKL
jgi:amino-acid N-acetyltransferase